MTNPNDSDELVTQFAEITARARRPAWHPSPKTSVRPGALGAISVTALAVIVAVALLGSRIPSPIEPGPSGTAAPQSPGTTAPSSALAEFAGAGFSFAYPATWSLISEYEQFGEHGSTVFASVGIGHFDVGCVTSPNSVECGQPRWSVPEDGIVLAYHRRPWLGTGEPEPTPTLREGDRWVEIDGQPAVLSQTDTSMTWHLPDAPTFIEVRWGQNVPNGPETAQAVIASWQWMATECPSALLEGVLEEVSGELQVAHGGRLAPVNWITAEYRVERIQGVLTVLDLAGNAKAREGDYVRLGGGMDPAESERFTVCGSFEVGPDQSSSPSAAPPSQAPTTRVLGDWRALPPSPIGDGRRTTSVWTGSEFIVWGAAGLADGAAYNPSTNTWRPLPNGPAGDARYMTAVWTGDVVIAWHGGIPTAPTEPDGGVYDPVTDTWSPISPSPLNSDYGQGVGWTGTELLVLTRDMVAAAYNPITNSWRDLPSPPLTPGSMEADWTGTEWLVLAFGSNPDVGGGVAALEPTSLTWTELAPSELRSDNDGRRAVWTGETWLWPSGGDESLEYDRAGDQWRTSEPGECGISSDSAAVAGSLIVWEAGALDTDNGACYDFPAPPPTEGLGENPAFAWTGTELLLWGGGSGTGDTTTTDGVAFRPTTPLQPEPERASANCRTLVMPEPLGELDTSLSVEEGLLDIVSYGDGGEDFARALVEFLDPLCLDHPVIGPLVDGLLVEALGSPDDLMNCDVFRALLEGGSVGYQSEPIAPDAVDDYINRWCFSQTAPQVDVFCTRVLVVDEPRGDFPRWLHWFVYVDAAAGEVLDWVELAVAGANDDAPERVDPVTDGEVAFELGLRQFGAVPVESFVVALRSGEIVDVTDELRDALEGITVRTGPEYGAPNGIYRQVFSSCAG